MAVLRNRRIILVKTLDHLRMLGVSPYVCQSVASDVSNPALRVTVRRDAQKYLARRFNNGIQTIMERMLRTVGGISLTVRQKLTELLQERIGGVFSDEAKFLQLLLGKRYVLAGFKVVH